MKKFSLKILFVALVILISGCGSPSVSPTTPPAKKIKTSKEFQFDRVNLDVTQLVDFDTIYHSDEELEDLLNIKLHSLLKQNNLLSTKTKMDRLVISAVYERRFVGDETPIPKDSLAYPRYEYTITVKNDLKILKKIEKLNIRYRGDLELTLQVISGTLKDKKYEVQFINSLADTIFKDIQNLNN